MRRAALPLALLLVGGALAALGAERTSEQQARLGGDEELLFLPRASALRALSLGHHELAADLVYLRAVIYFGTEISGKKQFRWLDHYLQTIVDLDPRWKTPYRWAGVATLYNGAPITRERIELSSHFLRLGVERFPSDWELPFMLACNLMFEMKPKDAAERARLQSEAGVWMRRASLVGGAPPWAALLAATILRKEGQNEAAVRHLEQVYYATTDERTREEVKNRLLSLKAQVDFDRETRDRARFEGEWKSTFPYLTPELFVLLGPPPPVDMDWRRRLER